MELDKKEVISVAINDIRISSTGYIHYMDFSFTKGMGLGRDIELQVKGILDNCEPITPTSHSSGARFCLSEKGGDMVIAGYDDWWEYKESLIPKPDKPKRDIWKILTFVVLAIGLIPTYIAIFPSNEIDEVRKENIELTKQLNELNIEYKAFVDSIHSIPPE